ncbi:hypothetical protein PIL02S_05861 [Paenibacillus illinoisensis]|uniref:Uncharacterized protein n=1 Tax=Paenibacillus illinoisensis TaxID=59845 RepID=A0A2W0C350_9BACL|nr:hypothetical protein PIL02S_05861 [Paenibacillus illinoisensis]
MVLITRCYYSALPVYPAPDKAFHLLRLMKSVSLEGKKRPVSPAKCNDPNTDYRVFYALRSETGCLCHVNVSAFSHYIIVLLTLSTTSQIEHFSQNHAKKHAFCRFRKQNTCSFLVRVYSQLCLFGTIRSGPKRMYFQIAKSLTFSLRHQFRILSLSTIRSSMFPSQHHDRIPVRAKSTECCLCRL